jgi:phospholipid N-methyltransferase
MEARPRSADDFDRLGNVWGLGGPDDQARLDFTTRFIEEHVDDPSVVVEGGALRGALTDRLLAAFPDAMLHLIEIAPSHVAVLRERFAGVERVAVHEADMLQLATLPVPPSDVVLLVECLYYLSQAERRAFVEELRSNHPAARVIVATPVTGGAYFTEPELRQLFDGYRLVGVEVVNQRWPLPGAVTRRVMGVAKRLNFDATAARVLRSRVAEHAIYAFAPGLSSPPPGA